MVTITSTKAQAPTTFSKKEASFSEDELQLRSYVRLRWGFVLFWVLIVLFAQWTEPSRTDFRSLWMATAASAVANIVFLSPTFHTRVLVGGLFVFDAMTVTSHLMRLGGAENPLCMTYLILITIAAIITPGIGAWATAAVSVIGYRVLFYFTPQALTHHWSGLFASARLEADWLSFVVTAGAIAFFVQKISRQLEQTRGQGERARRLAALTTMAAGAAHELATPLASIKMLSAELAAQMRERGGYDDWLSDMETMRGEVDRSREVLDRMGAGSGLVRGEAPSLRPLLPAFQTFERKDDLFQVQLSSKGLKADDLAMLPWESVLRMVRDLLNNAREANASLVRLQLVRRTRDLHLMLEDNGHGISAEILARIGQPFFSTKEHGMGLGIFLAQTLTQALRGSLVLESHEGKGTSIKLLFQDVLR